MNTRSLNEMIKRYAVRQGEFTLSSGEVSSYYIDLKHAYTRPEVLKEIARAMKEIISELNVDRIGGMELGAVPLAVALSMATEIPFIIVRKEKKGHGAGRRIEGGIKTGDVVVLVEDVVTTGGSLVSAVEAVRTAGGKCTKALTVVDRLSGAEEALKKINIDMESLLTIEDLGL